MRIHVQCPQCGHQSTISRRVYHIGRLGTCSRCGGRSYPAVLAETYTREKGKTHAITD